MKYVIDTKNVPAKYRKQLEEVLDKKTSIIVCGVSVDIEKEKK